MKKIYIITIITIISLVILSVAVVIKNKQNSFKGEEVVYTIKSNYTYNLLENNNLEVVFYSNNPKSFLKNYKGVIVTLKNEELTTILSGEVNNSKIVSTHYYKEEKMYAYKLYIKLANLSSNFEIKDCILETRDLSVEIGNVTIARHKDKHSSLDYTKIYAVANNHLGFKSINAFVVTIKNTTSSSKYLTDFYIGEYNYCDLSKAVVLDKDIDYSHDIKEFITNYNPISFTRKNYELEIKASSSIKLLIPVYYTNRSYLNNTFITINDEIYIDNFNYITNYDNLDSFEKVLKNAKLNNIESSN